MASASEAKKAARSEAAKKAAKTRAANKVRKSVDKLRAKYDAMGDTPEERRIAAREQKIAEIKRRDQDEKRKAAAKASKRSEAGKKAAKTRKNVKDFKLNGELKSLVSKIRKASDDEAVKLLREYLKK